MIPAYAYRPFRDPFYSFWISETEQAGADRTLTAADRQIALTRVLIRKYDAVKAGLCAALFSRGLDETGRLRPPRDDRPELYRHSVLGPIPRGWNADILGNLADVSAAPAASDAIAQNNGVLLTMDAAGKKIISVEPTAGQTCSETKGHPFQPGDVLLSKRWSRPCIARLAETRGACDGGLYALRPRGGLHSYFLFCLVTGPLFSKFMEDVCAARRAAAFTMAQVKRFRAAFPPLDEQERISRALAGMDRLVASEKAHLGKLICVKKGVMDDLRKGDVRAITTIAREEPPAPTTETAK